MAPFFMLEKFIVYLQIEKRYSEHTLCAYQNDIQQFIDFSQLNTVDELSNVNFRSIRKWIVEMVDSKLENKSVNRKLSALRSFFKWLKKENVVTTNPLSKISGPKNSKRLPSFAKESEIRTDRTEALFSGDYDGKLDQLMFEMFYQTGIRLSELINLKNLDVNNSSIKVLGKRNKERIIPVSKGLSDHITEYRKMKEGMDLKSNYFFVLKNGNKLYAKFVYRKINSYLGNVTNLEKCSPHVLRHTFATHMLNNGAGLETLKDILGHANLAATQVYTHNSFAKLTNIYSQAHPRGRKID